jgi:hypothetical protein
MRHGGRCVGSIEIIDRRACGFEGRAVASYLLERGFVTVGRAAYLGFISWQLKTSKICSALTSTLTTSTPLLSPAHLLPTLHSALHDPTSRWPLVSGLHHRHSAPTCSIEREGAFPCWIFSHSTPLSQNKATSFSLLFHTFPPSLSA